MTIKISQPSIILMDGDAEVSRHRSPEEAMEAASSLPNGRYRLVRPDGEIVVDLPTEAPPGEIPHIYPLIPTYIYVILNGVAFSEGLYLNASHSLSYEQGQEVLIEADASFGPVTFSWGGQTHTENSAPYQLNGDGNYVAFDAGLHEISIKAEGIEYIVSILVAEPEEETPTDPTDPLPDLPPSEPEDPGEREIVPYAQSQFPASYYDPDNTIGKIKSKFEFLPRDENGWTIIEPNPDNLVAYVDTVLGDDELGKLAPQGTSPDNAFPFKSFDAALKALPTTNSNGEMKSGAHHILLHDDQIFSTSPDHHTRIPSGDSHTERLVIGRYGNGTKPPLIDDFGRGYVRLWGLCRYVIIQGVNCDNKYRNPSNPDFLGWGNTTGEDLKGGFRLYSGDVGSSYILLEGLNMNYSNFKFNGRGHSQIIAHRCVVTNTYSEESHQQGVYAAGISQIMFDECIFDHDGWVKQREKEIKLNTKAEGRATFFNHNGYFTNGSDLWFRNIIFMRASSIGTKFTSNTPKDATEDVVMARRILMENIYYLEGEIGISAGGNTDHNTGHRWNHMYMIDIVFEAIGHSQPTNRSLAWGIDIHDWDKGAVVNPLFIPSDNENLTNTYAINVTGHCRDVKILNSIAVDIGAKSKTTGAYVIRYREQGQSNMSGILEEGSIIHNPNSQCRLLSDDVVEGITRKDCVYYSGKDNKDELFKFDEVYLTVEEAMAHPSMDNCQFARVVFKDPTRNVKTYMSSLGLEPTVEAFAAECAKQDIKNWRPEFTAQAVNAYLREGFTPIGIEQAA